MCSTHRTGCPHHASGASGDGASCACGGGRMARFMEPCLLLLLSQSPAHGYELLGRLGQFGLDPEQLHPGIMYRTLRRLEGDGFLTSSWDTGSSGPAKRLYQVTSEGEALLHSWSAAVERNIRSMEAFLRGYREHFGTADDVAITGE